MKETGRKDTFLFLQRMLENAYEQGDMEESVRLSRRLDEYQCHSLLEELGQEKAVG